MTAKELLDLLVANAKRYSPIALESMQRNRHLTYLDSTEVPTQEQIDAVLVDFVNSVAFRQCVDLALTVSDLHHDQK